MSGNVSAIKYAQHGGRGEMRTMKEMKHQTQQLLVSMETWAPTTAAGRTPSQLQMPLGPLRCGGAGMLGTAQPQWPRWSAQASAPIRCRGQHGGSGFPHALHLLLLNCSPSTPTPTDPPLEQILGHFRPWPGSDISPPRQFMGSLWRSSSLFHFLPAAGLGSH